MTPHIDDLETPGLSAKQGVVSFLALFTSTGTLLCCALPATITAIAGGAALVSFTTTFPWLIEIAAEKSWIFLVSGLMITLSGILIFRPKGRVACSLTGKDGCAVAGKVTKIVFWFSLGMYTVGAFFAYASVPILRLLNNSAS